MDQSNKNKKKRHVSNKKNKRVAVPQKNKRLTIEIRKERTEDLVVFITELSLMLLLNVVCLNTIGITAEKAVGINELFGSRFTGEFIRAAFLSAPSLFLACVFVARSLWRVRGLITIGSLGTVALYLLPHIILELL